MTTDPHLAGDPPGTWLKSLALHDLPRHSLAKNNQARAKLHHSRAKGNLTALSILLDLLLSICFPLIYAFWFMGTLEIIGVFSFLLLLIVQGHHQSHDPSSDEGEDTTSCHQAHQDPLSLQIDPEEE
jgi:hypothetical protein